jgi:hypothetical protein
MDLCFRYAGTARGQEQHWAVVYPVVRRCSTCLVDAGKDHYISSLDSSSNQNLSSGMIHLKTKSHLYTHCCKNLKSCQKFKLY